MSIVKFIFIAAFLTLASVALVSVAQAQEVVDLVRKEKITGDDASQAKAQLFDQAIEGLSLENIKGIIGEEKTARSQDIIKNKVIKNSSKYVLAIKGDNFAKHGDGYTMDVAIKLSLKGLRSLLLEQGLLYQMDGPPKVLPVVFIVDRPGGRSYGWWYQVSSKDHAFLEDQLQVFHKALREELLKIGFYGMMPVDSRFAQSVPDTYRGENLQRGDYLFLGEYFKSPVVLRGQITYRVKPNTENVFLIDVRLEALHSVNGRLMAEVTRTYETDPGSSYRQVVGKRFQEVIGKLTEDLSLQLAEGWKKGTFGASVVRLAVVGKISPKQLDEFKKMVVLHVRDIKSLRERLIEARKTTFEVDSSALPQQLAQSFRTTKFARFKVQVEDVTAEGLTIKVDTL